MSSFGYSVLGFGAFANRAIRVTISSDVDNPDLDGNDYFGATAWASGTPKILEVTSGTDIGSLVIPGSMGGTLTIENSGNIKGAAGSQGSAGTGGAGGAGGAGGHAITSASSFIYKGKSGSVLGGGGGGGGGGGRASPTSTQQQQTNQTYSRQPSNQYYYSWANQNYSYNLRNDPYNPGAQRIRWGGLYTDYAAQPTFHGPGPVTNQYFTMAPHGWTYRKGPRQGQGRNYGIYRTIQQPSTQSNQTNYTGGAGGAGGYGVGHPAQSPTSGASGSDGPGPAGTGGTGGDGGALGAAGSAGATGGGSGSSGGSGGAAGKAASFSSGSITIAEDSGDIDGATS